MSRRAKFTRRKFIKLAAAAAAAAPVVSCGGLGSSWRFFTAEEAQTIAAVAERLVPTDQDPGGAWAGVVNFIDIQLTGPYRRFRVAYRQGILGVDQSGLTLFGRKFAQLDRAQQDAVLATLEKDSAPGEVWKQRSASQFFDLVLSHALQGFYGDPRHGGNREGISWTMLGLPYPPIRG